MKTGNKGLALIKEFEGCELNAYRDPIGILTIGYGHTAAAGLPVPKAGMVITEQEAENILRHDLGQYEQAVLRYVTVPLSQDQFDALVSWTFNLGPKNLSISTMVKKLNAGNYGAVPSEMAKWNKAGGKILKGLIRRRAAEGDLFASSHAPGAIPPPPDIEPLDNPAKPASSGFFLALISLFARLFKRK